MTGIREGLESASRAVRADFDLLLETVRERGFPDATPDDLLWLYRQTAAPQDDRSARPNPKNGGSPAAKAKRPVVRKGASTIPAAKESGQGSLRSILAEIAVAYGGSEFNASDIVKRAIEANPDLKPDTVRRALDRMDGTELTKVDRGTYRVNSSVSQSTEIGTGTGAPQEKIAENQDSTAGQEAAGA